MQFNKILFPILAILFGFVSCQSNSDEDEKLIDISFATDEFVANAVRQYVSDTFAPNLLLKPSRIFNTKNNIIAEIEFFQYSNDRQILDTISTFKYNKITGEVTGDINFQTDMYEIYAVDEEPMGLYRAIQIIGKTNYGLEIDIDKIWYNWEKSIGYTRVDNVPFADDFVWAKQYYKRLEGEDNVYELVWDITYNDRRFIIGKYTEEIYYNGLNKENI